MSTNDQTDRQLYRLIITRGNATETFLLPDGPGWRLPQVEVCRTRRLAEQLTTETCKSWNLETYCLFLSNSATTPRDPPVEEYAVMEAVQQNGRAPAGGYWMTSAAAIRERTLPPDDRTAVTHLFQELCRYIASPDSSPFARPACLRELFNWVQQQIAPLGLRLTGGFRQFNAGPSFSLIRIETTGPAVWFKATGEPLRRELSITTTLARLFPGYVPTLWGVHSRWNGWLTPEIPGSTLDTFVDLSAWARAAKQLAQLQIASLEKTSELLQSECRDLTVEQLVQQIDPFLSLMSELMPAQKKPLPAPLTNSELTMLREQLMGACSLLEKLRLPNTLGHTDFNPGNILLSPGACVFLDWAEGCVANPLITLAYLCEYSKRQGFSSSKAAEAIVASYLEPWRPFGPTAALVEAIAVSPLLAAFAYAVSCNTWSSTALQDAKVGGYLRSLTRRMHREAVSILQGGELCLR